MENGKCSCFEQQCTCVLGMATVPKQQFGELYELDTALKCGTVFKDLDLPFYMGGDKYGQ